MCTVYENEGHRRASMKNYHRLAWKCQAWRQDPHCVLCGKLTHNIQFSDNWKDKATVDHRLARCLGGTDTEENFDLVCGHCNNKKSKLESKQAALNKALTLSTSENDL